MTRQETWTQYCQDEIKEAVKCRLRKIHAQGSLTPLQVVFYQSWITDYQRAQFGR